VSVSVMTAQTAALWKCRSDYSKNSYQMQHFRSK